MTKTFLIKTLTPIWTGGIDRDSSEIRETGILGSLRWWYEGIIRGLGGYACDPTDKPPCKAGKNEEKICAVCELFGCTGQSRKYRLNIKNINTIPLFFVSDPNVYLSNGNWLFRIFGGHDLGGAKYGKGFDTKFSFGVKTLWSRDPFELTFTTLRDNEGNTIDIISYLLAFIAKYGGIGAKTQNGFGQIAIIEGLDNDAVARGKDSIEKTINSISIPCKPQDSYFSTINFFSNLYQIGTTHYVDNVKMIGSPPSNFDFRRHFIPCAYDIRYKSMMKHPITGKGKNFGLRPFLKEKINRIDVNDLLGNSSARTDKDRSASKIHVSHLFYDNHSRQYRLKIWGYVPTNTSVEAVEASVNDFILHQMFPKSEIILSYNRG